MGRFGIAASFAFLFQPIALALDLAGMAMVEHPVKDVTAASPRFIEDVYNAKQLHSAHGHRSPIKFDEEHARLMFKSAA